MVPVTKSSTTSRSIGCRKQGVSASRLYWEYKGGFFNAKGVSIPVAVIAFPGEQYEASQCWTQSAHAKPIYYNRAQKDGHFATWG